MIGSRCWSLIHSTRESVHLDYLSGTSSYIYKVLKSANYADLSFNDTMAASVTASSAS